MTGRIRWLVIGAVVFSTIGFVAAWKLRTPTPPDPNLVLRETVALLERKLGFVRAEVVKTEATMRESLIEEARLRELSEDQIEEIRRLRVQLRVQAEVEPAPAETIEVVREIPVEIPADCPSYSPAIDLGGSCEVIGVGGKPYLVQAWWSAQADVEALGAHWRARRGPVLADTLTVEVPPPLPPQSDWTRFEGRLGFGSDSALEVGLTWYPWARKRFFRRIGVYGAYQRADVTTDTFLPMSWGDYPETRSDWESRVMGGVAVRF